MATRPASRDAAARDLHALLRQHVPDLAVRQQFSTRIAAFTAACVREDREKRATASDPNADKAGAVPAALNTLETKIATVFDRLEVVLDRTFGKL